VNPSFSPYPDRPAGPDAPFGRPPARPDPPPGGGRTEPVFKSLCGLMARTQVTRVRVWALLGLGILAILSGLAYGNGVRTGVIKQPLVSGTRWIDDFGLGFVVPVATLLFASSMFGDPTDDKTLVYLWLRPIARRKLTAAAALTSFVVTWPLVVPAMAATAACTGGGRDLVVGTVVACTVGVAAYTGVFVALGSRVKLPVVWGLLYVIIWEKYVSTASGFTKALALRAYGTSTLSHFTGVDAGDGSSQLALAFLPLVPALVVPLVISALALMYATRRLSREDVA
jgi:ABC-2 type transport system permease protein